jgi:SNF2 family DNA or RNA helicase
MKAFATRTELMSHQVAAVEKIRPVCVSGLFMEMGTGKTRAAIEAAKIRAAKIDRVIWYCPVALKETIRREILKHTDCEDVYVFDDKTTMSNIPPARWYIVGIESMSSSARVIATANALTTDKTMIILDESSYIKGHNSLRTQRITFISERAKYRLILTGTPLSQGVVDLYSQMKFLSPKILGYSSFYSFAANHLEYSEKFPGMIVRAHNIPYIAAKIQPYVYQVTKAECLDLPSKSYEKRWVSMTWQQREWYEIAKEEILSDMLDDRDEFSSIAIYRLFTALQCIASGFWNRKGSLIEIPCNRPDAMIAVAREVPQDAKIVIFAKFQYDIKAVRAALEADFGPGCVAEFHGGLTEKHKEQELQRFRSDARFFLATQSSGGHGLTLNEAHYVIFYNNGFKYSERLQAEDRCHRIGQESKVTYIDIICNRSIDERIQDALCKKGNAVSAFKDAVDRVKDKKANVKEMIKSL